MYRSRLSRTADKKTKQKLILSLIGIVFVLFFLVKWGVPLLVNFSLFLGNIKGGSQTNATNSANSNIVLLPPTLNPAVNATNSATITISGSSVPSVAVQLYVNNDLVDVTDTKNDGSFTFNNVSLPSQQNTIKVKAKKDTKESDFSDQISVTYINKAPNLSVDSPQDGQSFSKDPNSVNVKGKTDPNVRVTVNDFWAIVDDSGNYSYTLTLQNGDNQIKVVATDAAGNKTEKDLKVTYSP
ncbi:MAG: Ig-like domain-containing protein [Candidatus Levyibacteriota bacterium]